MLLLGKCGKYLQLHPKRSRHLCPTEAVSQEVEPQIISVASCEDLSVRQGHWHLQGPPRRALGASFGFPLRR